MAVALKVYNTESPLPPKTAVSRRIFLPFLAKLDKFDFLGGVLVEGFDQMGNMVTWYSLPYYKDHFEKLGLTKEKEYIESDFSFSNINPEPFQKASSLIKKRYELRTLNFTKTKKNYALG